MFIQCFEEIRNSVRAGSHFQKGKEQCWDSTGTEGEQSSKSWTPPCFQKGFRTFEKIHVSSFQHPGTEKETKVVKQGMLQRQCNDSAADTKVGTVAPESQGQLQLSRRKSLLIPKARPLLLPSYSNVQHKDSDRVVALIKQNAIHSWEHSKEWELME